MEDLALSIDEQNKKDWERLPALATQLWRRANKPVAPAQGRGRHAGNTGLIGMSFADTLRRHIPEDSKAALSMRQRRGTCWDLRSPGYVKGSIASSALSLIKNWRAMASHRGQPEILLVEDIDLDTCKALCEEYPEALDPVLLARHIIRFDEIHSTSDSVDAIEQSLKLRYPRAGIKVETLDKLILIRATSLDHGPMVDENGRGAYLDFTVETSQQSEFGPLRGRMDMREDVSRLDALGKWRLISARMSCFKLDTNLYLVLVDSLPAPDSPLPAVPRPVEKYPSKVICMSGSRWGKLKIPPNPCERDNTRVTPLCQIHALFKTFTVQSILQPQSMPTKFATSTSRVSQYVFRWLLFASSWESSAKRLESDLRGLQREAAAAIAGDQVFAKLTALRRQLAGAYGMLAEGQELMKRQLQSGNMRWDVNGDEMDAEKFWSREWCQRMVMHTHGQAKSIDLRDIPALVEELLGRFRTVTQTVNEEIQMVIGSVQVEDARVMRRQTEWTVVLAVLAAIYLPMTLVTGIFGMNITEIGEETTRPDRWSVVKAWGIVFGATMGSVLVYAVARYILRYRRVGRMLLRNIGGGWLYRKFLALKARLQKLWLYQKVYSLKEKMREWDVEAQKMEKME